MGVHESGQHQPTAQVDNLPIQRNRIFAAHGQNASALNLNTCFGINRIFGIHGKDRAVC